MRYLFSFTFILCSFHSAAKLVDVEIHHTSNISAFGLELEAIEGQLYFEFDPQAPENQQIVDINLAPLKDGKVQAKSSFYIIQPVDPDLRKGTLLEISNRGSKASLRYFNQAPSDPQPNTIEALGDGLIQRLGLSVMWVGWQADVFAKDNNMWVQLPRAIDTKGIARSDWTLENDTNELSLAHRANIDVLYTIDIAKQSEAYLTQRFSPNGLKKIVPPTQWSFSEQGDAIIGNFSPGIYELVYPTQSSVIGGLGFALIRDTVEYIKSPNSKFYSPTTIAFGVSQTGRWLRHFLYQGFNQSESGSMAFDGMLIHTAGAGRGSFNHRFAQPSRDAHRMSAFFYPTDVFPFTSTETEHPISGLKDGLMSHLPEAFYPKVFFTNTGYEYWGRAAALIHSHMGKDIEPLSTERVYHLASAQHFVERQSNVVPIEGQKGYFQGNSLNLLLHLRALLSELSHWVIDDKTPPLSRFPRYADNTLLAFENYALPQRLKALKKPVSPHTAYIYDYGEQWKDGRITLNPPRLLATIIPPVPATDEYGNELGGIRHPLLAQPIASFLPWALRHDAHFARDEMMDFRGSIKLLPKAEVLSRYQNFENYRQSLNMAIDEAVKGRVLLEEDRAYVLDEGQWLWRKATGD